MYEEPAASAPSAESGSGPSDGGGAVVVETQQSSCDDRGAGADVCRLGELLARATGPAPAPAPAPAAPGGGGRVVVSVHDLAALSLSGSGITRQPPGPQVLSTKPFIVYTSSATRTYTAQILGRAVTIETTPISYLWDFGDGVYLSTTDPGAAWPDHTVWHDYTTTHTQIHTTLTTTWRARYQPAGTSAWRPIPGTLTTTETTTAYDVVRTITYLTDDAEEEQNH
ncbi:Uncharacterised protein [Actinomyces slackii]|uniref:PKD domain-containing protein n=1 Tax=Actinomyces slackii TaxID=52774 RepID=A0A3S4SU75_9ACTO|nr:Uncharacterised protein [Actinomyces slackii]